LREELLSKESKSFDPVLSDLLKAVPQGVLENLLAPTLRTDKVVQKDAKFRTFIVDDKNRKGLTLHAYDVHYGVVRPHLDTLVVLDDSIVRGNTLVTAILPTIHGYLQPKRIIVMSSAPMIKYPCTYGIDMAKLGDLLAFRACVELVKEYNLTHEIEPIYQECLKVTAKPVHPYYHVEGYRDVTLETASQEFNPVTKLYALFPDELLIKKCAELVTPEDCTGKVELLYQTIEGVETALPDYRGMWYFNGVYPTPGGLRACCKSFCLWHEGRGSMRCYGVIEDEE
jgi:amidophosphoribosyltransferase